MGDQIITADIKKIDITSLQGTTITLTNIFVKLNIYESLFNNFKTGQITVKDTFDIIQIFPLVGGEDLTIFFSSPNDSDAQKAKIQKFKLYKVEPDSGVHRIDSENKLLVLYFCSVEMLKDNSKAISKRWKDVPASGPLGYIHKDIWASEKDLFQHSAPNLLDFITNFWTPTRLIQYLEKEAIGSFDDFIFYENMFGFNFHSISELLALPYSHEIKFEDSPDALYDYTIAQAKKMSKYGNDLESLKFGALGNTYFKLKPFVYGFEKYEEDFTSVTKYGTSLGKHVQHKSDLLNFNTINITYDEDGHHITKRDLLIKSLSKYHQIVKLNGDSTKTIGQIFKFKISDRIREEENPNELMTGNWFCTHCNHELTADGKYIIKAKLVKNAFFDFNTFASVQGGKNI